MLSSSEIQISNLTEEESGDGDLAFNLDAGPRGLRWAMRLNGAWGRFGPTRMQRAVIFKNREALADFYRWAMAPSSFHAVKPPPMWQTFSMPMRCTACVANAERQPLAQ